MGCAVTGEEDSQRGTRDAGARSGARDVVGCGDGALDGLLLEHLRRIFDDDRLAYRVPPRPITHGADTTTLVLQLEGRAFPSRAFVVRMFRDQSAGARARLEALIQSTLADTGFPAARVVEVSLGGVVERPFILMEQLEGLPLLARLGSLGGDGGFSIPSATTIAREASTLPLVPRLLAQVQHRLHAVDVRPLTRALRASGLEDDIFTVDAHLSSVAQATEDLGLDELAQFLQWLRDHRPVERVRVICHGDVQPLNVLARRYRVTGLVDWSWTTLAEPELDVGFANASFATAPVEAPRLLRTIIERAQRQFSSSYLRAARRQAALDPKRVEYYQVLSCALAIGSVARRRHGCARDTAADNGASIYDCDAGVRSLHEYVRSVTRPFAVGASAGRAR